jgi:DUF4097 and DUF4098 domain-containing protein YvlB
MRSLFLFLALVPAFAVANECKFTAQHDFNVDAAGLATVALALGSTDVVVEGVSDLARVEVQARACASDQAWLAGLTVDQQRSGDRLILTPHEQRDTNWNGFHSSYAYLELHVRVPAKLALDISGSSGDARVRKVAALAFKSSSGDLEVDQVAGALTVTVSSGDVNGGDVGSLDVKRTSSGDITLHDVRGDVKVAGAGSGDLHFDNVGGGVSIGSVGSGDVSARHVEHDVTLDSIGSGDISVDSVGGNFTVRAQGSGDVRQHDVRGTVSVPHRDDD